MSRKSTKRPDVGSSATLITRAAVQLKVGETMQAGMKHSTLQAMENADELFLVRLRFGSVIKKLRNERKAHSLRSLGDALGISAKYLSEIENGLKMPEDELIAKIAREFRISEVKLFKIAKRVPYSARQVIEKNGEMMELVAKLTKADAVTLEAVKQLLNA